ncbi:MAG TPA: TlpA disulfide reductase family protein [Polyangiaceae bacterium]|nr:TlpA disulfide reductase family protein [Polyangiaceae bacterium]
MASPNDSVNAASAAAGSAPGSDRLRRFRRGVLEVLLFVALFLGVTTFQERNLLARHSPAPAFTLTALGGNRVSLESLRGKRVLLHFWATWCGVCRQEFGALDAVERKLGPDEALVTVVADSDDPARLKAFAEEKGIHYPVLLADDETIRNYRVGMFPTNYYLDGQGRIAGHTVGMSSRWSMLARLWLAR